MPKKSGNIFFEGEEQVLKARSFISLQQLQKGKKVSEGSIGNSQDENDPELKYNSIHMELDLVSSSREDKNVQN